RALRLDLWRRRRQEGSDRGMASFAPGPAGLVTERGGSDLPGWPWRRGAGRGRRVVAGPGSGLFEEPVAGLQSGRAATESFPCCPPGPLARAAARRAPACRQAKMALLTCRLSARRASLGVLPSASFLS